MHCGRVIRLKPVHFDRYTYCGMRCRKAARMNRDYDKAIAAMAKIQAYKKLLTPEELNALRGTIVSSMDSHIQMAHEVLAGTRVWTPAQVGVFRALLNKVVPDLSASYVQKEVHNFNTETLSIAELEALVLQPPPGIPLTPTQDLIDVTPQGNDPP